MTKNFWKKLFILLLLAGVVYFTYRLGGRILSKVAVNRISKLTNTEVTAESVEFGLNGSVTLKNLVLEPKDKSDYDNAILKAGTVSVKFSRLSFLTFNPKLKQLSADYFDFNIVYNRQSGKWNTSEIKMNFGSKGDDFDPPTINLQNGQVQYGIIRDETICQITQIPLEVRLTDSEKEENAYDFRIETAKKEGIAGKSQLNGVWKNGRVWVTGSVSSKDLPNIEVNWSIYALSGEFQYGNSGNYQLNLSIKDFVSEHQLESISLTDGENGVLQELKALASSQKFFNRYRPSGRIDLEMEAAGNLNNLKESDISGTVLCKDVSVYDRKFPYEIKRLNGKIEFTKNSVSLVNLKGRHGETELRISGNVSNFGQEKSLDIHLRSDNMKLDKDLEYAIPDKFREQWDKFELEGEVRIYFHSHREPGSEKRKKLKVYPSDINVIYKPFPYPLKQVNGELTFQDGEADINDIIAEYEGKKITINGNVDKQASTSQLNIECENLPVDEQLKSILAQTDINIGEEIELLDGLINSEIKIRKTREDKKETYSAKLYLKDASLKTEFLEETIKNVDADFIFEEDKLYISRFTGSLHGGELSVTGEYTLPKDNSLPAYDLVIEGNNTELRTIPIEQLEGFVGQTDILKNTKMAGTADYRLEVSKEKSETRPNYNLALDFTGASSEFTNIPYSLGNITGKVRAVNGRIEFSDITANLEGRLQITNQQNTVSLNGKLDLRKDVPVKGKLSIRAENISLDENLKSVLGEKSKAIYEKMAPTGKFDLNFPVCNLVKKNGIYTVELAGRVNLKNVASPRLKLLEEANLLIYTECIYITSGDIRIDNTHIENGSLRIKGKTIKNISANVSFDPNENNFSISDIAGDFYGGKIAANLQSRLKADNTIEYGCKAYLNNVSLEKFLEESDKNITADKKYRSGTIGGNIQLENSNSPDGSTGNMNILIKDIKAGKVSLPGKIFRIIRRKPAPQYAFDRAVIKAYIRNDSLFVENISLVGEGSNLEGNGVINIKSNQMYLTFAMKSAGIQKPGIIDSLTEALGPAVVRIEATGSIYEPKVKTTTLPVLRDTINILGKPRQ